MIKVKYTIKKKKALIAIIDMERCGWHLLIEDQIKRASQKEDLSDLLAQPSPLLWVDSCCTLLLLTALLLSNPESPGLYSSLRTCSSPGTSQVFDTRWWLLTPSIMDWATPGLLQCETFAVGLLLLKRHPAPAASHWWFSASQVWNNCYYFNISWY